MNIPYGPILVVEDVPTILELLEITLRFKGYPVVTALNGQAALERIAEERPALVITDILMPKLDGFALVQKLRSDPQTSNIPIIFLSATYLTPEDKSFAMSLGVSRFLEKPVDTEEFLLTVAEVLTAGPSTLPEPLDEREFYLGYRERLGNKLHHKIGQIQRTERLLETLPEEEKPAFRALLEEARIQRNEIEKELDELYRILEQYPNSI
jgi:CheY-like chemotaxis protein